MNELIRQALIKAGEILRRRPKEELEAALNKNLKNFSPDYWEDDNMHGCGKDCCVIEEIVDPFYNKEGFRCRCTRCDLVTEVKASEGGAICEWMMNNLTTQGLFAEVVRVISSRAWKGG